MPFPDKTPAQAPASPATKRPPGPGQPAGPNAGPGGGGGAAAPAPAAPAVAKGDMVMDPLGLGRDVVLTVDRVAGPIAWVVGDCFEDPTPWSVDDLIVLDKTEAAMKSMDSAAARLGAILQDPAGYASDAIERLSKGLESLAPEVHKTGIPSLLLTYSALMGIIEDVKQDQRFVYGPAGDKSQPESERGSSVWEP